MIIFPCTVFYLIPFGWIFICNSKAENTQRFLRVYVEKAESDATVKTEIVKGVRKVTTTTSGNATRFNVYWEDNVDEAQVKITVTAKAREVRRNIC